MDAHIEVNLMFSQEFDISFKQRFDIKYSHNHTTIIGRNKEDI